jgi:hypothetical protein
MMDEFPVTPGELRLAADRCEKRDEYIAFLLRQAADLIEALREHARPPQPGDTRPIDRLIHAEWARTSATMQG